MLRCVVLILCAAWLLPGCRPTVDQPVTKAPEDCRATANSGGSINVEIVRKFFKDLGDGRYTISRGEPGLNEPDAHVLRWVLEAIPPAEIRRCDIQALNFSKAIAGAASAYELKRHAAKGFSPLLPGRTYIQLHAVHAASDPEFHGVIDGNEPKLLSFWGEGA